MASHACTQTHTPTHTAAHTHPMLSSSVHLCQYICIVWRPRFILLTYFLHQKQSLWQLGEGLILCKCMQISVTQNSIHIGPMQIMFAKQAYWKGPVFPSPLTSNPAIRTSSQSFLPTLPSPPQLEFPYAFAFLKKKNHFPFCPPSVSLNPLSTLFLHLASNYAQVRSPSSHQAHPPPTFSFSL